MIWDSWSASAAVSHLAIGWTHLSLDKLWHQPLMLTLSAPCVAVNTVCRAAVSGTKLFPWAFLPKCNVDVGKERFDSDLRESLASVLESRSLLIVFLERRRNRGR